MKKIILYCIIVIGGFTACEDVYYPKIDSVESVIVADARIVVGNSNNFIRLYKSIGFNESDNGYPPISNAFVSLITSNGETIELAVSGNGYYPIDFLLDSELEYKLQIRYNGDTFESSFEPVPNFPALDTVYGIAETQLVFGAGGTDVKDAYEKVGVQMYADIGNEKEMPYYRFTAKKVMEYTYDVETAMMPIIYYCWKTFSPQVDFNIAAPPEFSNTTDIVKHPLCFLEKLPIANGNRFIGWILVLYQHGLSNSGYNYYDDLNSQLNSEGKLFDPMYVQARSNLTCTNNTNKTILGNFEISRVREYRFFVRYQSEEIGYMIKPIYDFYDIPYQGEQRDYPPDFWEPKAH